MQKLILVCLGSSIGGGFRYILGQIITNRSNFPYATLIVNILGCFLIGIFAALITKGKPDNIWISHLLIIGFCGGFTTFSAFSFELLEMIKISDYSKVSIYILNSIVGGILFSWLGFSLFQK